MAKQESNRELLNSLKIPDRWDYPVLKNGEYNKAFEFRIKGKCSVIIKTGIQDGFWTLGYDVMLGDNSGFGRNPGRKWGEFKTEKDALLDGIEYIEKRLHCYKPKTDMSIAIHSAISSALKDLDAKKQLLTQGSQLKLFA